MVGLGSDGLQRAGIAALGIDGGQVLMDGDAARLRTQGFLEDFLGLHVAAIGQVNVGFGDRVDVASGVQLAGRVSHGGSATTDRASVLCVHSLAAAGAEEGIGLQAAFDESAVQRRRVLLGFARAVNAEADQAKRSKHAGGNQRVLGQSVQEGRLFDGSRCGCWPLACRCSRGRRRASCCFLGGRSGFRSCIGCSAGSGQCVGSCRHCGTGGRQSRAGCVRGGDSSSRGRHCSGGSCRCHWRSAGCRGGDGHGNARGGRPRCLASCGTRSRLQLRQVFDVLVQFGDTLRLLFGLTRFRNFGFRAAWCCPFGKGEAILGGRRCAAVLNLSLHATRSAAANSYRGGGLDARGQATSEAAEVFRLRDDSAAGIAAGHCGGLLGRRHVQHCAGAHAIHVATDESVGVGAQHGDQHLVERDALRACGTGDAVSRIAALHRHLPAATGRLRRGGCGGRVGPTRRTCGPLGTLDRCGFRARRRGLLRHGGWRGDDRGRCRRRRRGGARFGHADRGRCGAARRIDQHGVVANHTAIGPVRFNHHA